MIDGILHDVFKGLKSDIQWRDFSEVGEQDTYNGFYYAGDRLYVIKDVMIDTYFFVEASSPVSALNKYRRRMEEASNAGNFWQEDPEYD